MRKEFTDWIKELNRDKRHLIINHGWGVPEREFYFYTKDEVEEKWDEISKRSGSLIETINLYCDEELTSVLFPWNYIIPNVYGVAMGSLKRKSFISNRTLLLHYIMTGHMEFFEKNKSVDKCIFPEEVNPLNDTMVFIPTETYNNMMEDKKGLLF